MIKKQTATALAATMTAAMVPLLSMAPASARATPQGTRVTALGTRVTAIPARVGFAPAHKPTARVSPDTSSPGISPSVKTLHIPIGGGFVCDAETLCAVVWDPNAENWAVFEMYVCDTYTLSNWNGSGYYLDNQTPGTVSYFFGEHGNALQVFGPGGGLTPVDRSPVYFIQDC